MVEDLQKQRSTSAFPSPPWQLGFLNGMALGTVCPLLYYIIDLGDGTPLGLLFAFDCVGRIAGGPMLRWARRIAGDKCVVVSAEAIAVLSYGLLAAIAHIHSGLQSSLELLYFCTFLRAAAFCGFPTVRSLAIPANAGRSASLAGLIAGCALCAGLAYHWPPVSHILLTSRLTCPAECAAAVSSIAVIFSFFRFPMIQSKPATFPNGPAQSYLLQGQNRQFELLLCEAAFAAAICIEPLIGWESFAVGPAGIAILVALCSAISLIIEPLASGSVSAANRSYRPSLYLGLLCLALGAAAFTGSCTLSRSPQPHLLLAGYWAFWIGGAFLGLSHGLLRAVFRLPHASPVQLKGFPNVPLGPAVSIASAMAVLLAATLFAAHERSAFMLPAVLAASSFIVTLW